MNQKLVDSVVHAVLYEGCILYPYRASSANKNRQRFTFGRVYPEPYSVALHGAEPCTMQTQCLIEGPSSSRVEVTVRFLQPMERDIGELAAPLRKLPPPDNPDFFHVVAELKIGGTLYQSWQEAVERTIHMPAQTLGELCAQAYTIPFSFIRTRSIEPIFDKKDHIAGVIVRRQEVIDGKVEVSAEPVDQSVVKITVRILNLSPVPSDYLDDSNEIGMRTFASTHTILHAKGGDFLSQIDPAETYARAAAGCRNLGTWPVLVGDEAKQERDTMVSSPIILYDYPKIAPESAGEIDEILTLRIMTMTDEEKRERRGVDEQARRQRTISGFEVTTSPTR